MRNWVNFCHVYSIDSSQEEFFDVKIISEKLGQFIAFGVISSKELTQSPKVELFHRPDNIIFAIADLLEVKIEQYLLNHQIVMIINFLQKIVVSLIKSIFQKMHLQYFFQVKVSFA